MKALLLMIALTLTLVAGQHKAILLGPSYHVYEDLNNLTYGIGYEYEFANGIELHTGVYENSYDRTSVAVGIGYAYHLTEDISVMTSVSYGTGYEALDSVMPLVSVQYKFVRVVTSYYVTNIQLIYEF